MVPDCDVRCVSCSMGVIVNFYYVPFTSRPIYVMFHVLCVTWCSTCDMLHVCHVLCVSCVMYLAVVSCRRHNVMSNTRCTRGAPTVHVVRQKSKFIDTWRTTCKIGAPRVNYCVPPPSPILFVRIAGNGGGEEGAEGGKGRAKARKGAPRPRREQTSLKMARVGRKILARGSPPIIPPHPSHFLAIFRRAALLLAQVDQSQFCASVVCAPGQW